MARPSSYNLATAARICADVTAGVPKSSAFATNGICEKTGFNWEKKHPEFAEMLREAQARFENLRSVARPVVRVNK